MPETDTPVASITYKLLQSGRMRIEAEGTEPQEIEKIARLATSTAAPFPVTRLVSISVSLPDPLLRTLVHEINVAYSLQLFTSTWVCLRKLFENLIIELLRRRFGTSDVSLYYWTGHHRFHDFSVLIVNLESKANDFRTYTSGFNQGFFDFLKKFKRRANTNAHSIDVLQDSKRIDDIKDTVNNCIDLLHTVIGRIQST